ncbi:putative ACR, YggU family [Candidatus Tiddalikarchaeum anstoanum]|nr:putative ACR, YggU family [Candidatus Tiddalikarchaeum anstoanum]
MIISVKVKTNSPVENVERIDDYYKVCLTNKPVNGRANSELVKLLKRHFKKNVEIVSGEFSNKKLIKIE